MESNGGKWREFCNYGEFNMEEKALEKQRFISTFSRTVWADATVLIGYKNNEEIRSSVWAKDIVSNVE